MSRNEFSRDYAYNRKLFARTSHGFYVLNPAISLRAGKAWVPVYDRLNPPEVERHLGYRAEIEERVAFRARYAKDPAAAIPSLGIGIEIEDTPDAGPNKDQSDVVSEVNTERRQEIKPELALKRVESPRTTPPQGELFPLDEP